MKIDTVIADLYWDRPSVLYAFSKGEMARDMRCKDIYDVIEFFDEISSVTSKRTELIFEFDADNLELLYDTMQVVRTEFKRSIRR